MGKCICALECGTQLIQETKLFQNGIPTKTSLAHSQFSGRLLLSVRVPAQVLSTRHSGIAFLPYCHLLLVRILSWSSLEFTIARVWLWASCGKIFLRFFWGGI